LYSFGVTCRLEVNRKRCGDAAEPFSYVGYARVNSSVFSLALKVPRVLAAVAVVRGVARNLFLGGQNRGTGDRSPPAGSRGITLVEVWGRFQKLKIYMLITILQ